MIFWQIHIRIIDVVTPYLCLVNNVPMIWICTLDVDRKCSSCSTPSSTRQQTSRRGGRDQRDYGGGYRSHREPRISLPRNGVRTLLLLKGSIGINWRGCWQVWGSRPIPKSLLETKDWLGCGRLLAKVPVSRGNPWKDVVRREGWRTICATVDGIFSWIWIQSAQILWVSSRNSWKRNHICFK